MQRQDGTDIRKKIINLYKCEMTKEKKKVILIVKLIRCRCRTRKNKDTRIKL